MTKEGGRSPDLHQDRLEDYDELGVVCPAHTSEKKLLSRIDWHLLPFISLLYLLAFLDRVNVANAKSFGLTEDLKLGGVEYNTILTIFFVPCKSIWRCTFPLSVFAGPRSICLSRHNSCATMD